VEGYRDDTWGERMAHRYDQIFAWADPAPVVDAIERLLDGRGPVLELGIGTGRLAVPLVRRGIEVHGVDNSPAMLERLRAQPEAAQMSLTFGDFVEVPVDGRYPLVLILFNTFPEVRTQERQLRCIERAAAHLTDDGVLALEMDLYPAGPHERQAVSTAGVQLDGAHLGIARYRPSEQIVEQQHVYLTEQGTVLHPVMERYPWPSELDLMARLAGLRLLERWGGWDRRPFDDDSRRHVSLYARQPASSAT